LKQKTEKPIRFKNLIHHAIVPLLTIGSFEISVVTNQNVITIEKSREKQKYLLIQRVSFELLDPLVRSTQKKKRGRLNGYVKREIHLHPCLILSQLVKTA
jgi:hypothetical protein